MSKNKEKDLISIIIPAYNSEKVIVPCLDSLASQTIKNFEAILINDGSTDNTLEVVNSYKDKIENLVVITKKNEGQGVARNIGLEKAKGNYIMFIDSDDFIEPNYLEVMLKAIKDGDYDIVISGYKSYRDDYSFRSIEIRKDTYWTRFRVQVPWSKIYKSSLIKDNNLHFTVTRIFEDNAFSISAVTYTDKIKIIDNTGYGYYMRTNSTSSIYFIGFTTNIIDVNNAFLEGMNKEFYKTHEKEMWYFFIKHTVVYMLSPGKRVTPKEFVSKNNEMMAWLEENIEMFKKKKVTSLFFPKDEDFKVKLIVHIYTLLNKLHLIPLFARIYCNPSAKYKRNR